MTGCIRVSVLHLKPSPPFSLGGGEGGVSLWGAHISMDYCRNALDELTQMLCSSRAVLFRRLSPLSQGGNRKFDKSIFRLREYNFIIPKGKFLWQQYEHREISNVTWIWHNWDCIKQQQQQQTKNNRPKTTHSKRVHQAWNMLKSLSNSMQTHISMVTPPPNPHLRHIQSPA